jgi:hypothetical protein
LPHIGRHEYRNHGWDAVEKFLASEVERDAVAAIRFYRQMYDQRTAMPRWFRHSDEAHTVMMLGWIHLP